MIAAGRKWPEHGTREFVEQAVQVAIDALSSAVEDIANCHVIWHELTPEDILNECSETVTRLLADMRAAQTSPTIPSHGETP